MRIPKERHLTGTQSIAPRAYEAPHAAVAREAAAEGIVLLENKGQLLPLAKGRKLAVFGAGAAKTVKGGTGSGDVNERYSVSIALGLENAGFQITTRKWLDDFEKTYTASRQAWKEKIIKEAEAMKASGSLYGFFTAYASNQYSMPVGGAPYATDTDTALFAVARIAGESADRHAVEGDYYLSREEHRLLADICRLYPNVIVVVNTGGVIDLSFMDEFENIRALLVVSQPGMEGGSAVAEVISGKISPSGKLTDTWAFQYADYPNAKTFSHNNGNVEKEFYEEGLYVGYRYFDSFHIPVRYGFGFGRSYTTFSLKTEQVTAEGRNVAVKVLVENTGTWEGKEVVQLYVEPPEGRLEKEARRLVAFAKTKSLMPGEKTVLTLRFTADAAGSYDEAEACWILEAGAYGIYVGSSLDQSALVACLSLREKKVLTKTVNICPMRQPIRLLHQKEAEKKRRYQQMLENAQSCTNILWELSEVEARTVKQVLEEPEDEAAAIVQTLTAEEMTALVTGDPGKGQGSELGSAGISVPGSAGETSSCALKKGIANIVLADGPAGLRLNQHYYAVDGKAQMLPFEASIEHGFFEEDAQREGKRYYQFCTAIPVGTMLAQTWNVPLLEKVGAMVGEEMKEFGVQLWLAPGMNIHRNPLCGRNFEYYSEDPVLSGQCAAAITRGVQSQRGIGTTIKHFACNNQEDNRMRSDSILPERVLREIYLKGFEIAIRDSQPYAMMTSYNLINGVHAANNYDLCTKAARMEFGFQGILMTDWTTTNIDDTCTASGCMRAGNDLVMPGTLSDHENLRAELAAGTLSADDLRRCVTRLLRSILKTDQYA